MVNPRVFNPKMLNPSLVELERSIVELKHLECNDESIQQLVYNIFKLDCDTKRKDMDTTSHKEFADDYLGQCFLMRVFYEQLFGEKGWLYIMDAVYYFGNQKFAQSPSKI